MQCGDQNLAIFRSSRPPLSPPERAARIAHPLGQAHHAFRVSPQDFARARDELAAAGLDCARPIDWGDHDCLYFLDPDGNLLEIISYR
jgi:catechol 2,3-dioxygenase-like lactoylglutathione lyase family enzyme